MIAIFLACGLLVLLFGYLLFSVVSRVSSNLAGAGELQTILMRVGYVLLAIAVAAALLGFGLSLLGSSAMGVVKLLVAGLVFVFVLFAISMPEAAVRITGVRNRARQAEFLWVLAIAVKSGRPLADEIEAYAHGTVGKRQRLLLDMAERLRDGENLTEIVVPQGLLPQSATMQIHSGISSKSLTESLSTTAVRVTRDLAEDQELGGNGGSLIYPAALIPAIFSIVSFLMYYIIPKFKKIFDDFGTELPGITVVLIRISDDVVNYWFLLGAPLFYIPLGVFVFVMFTEYFGWRTVSQSILGRWFVRWHSADVLRALAQGISNGVPIDQALVPIVKYAGPIHLRERLAWAVDAIQSGSPTWQSLQKAGILTFREAVALETAQTTGNLEWALGTLATTIERRWMFRLRAILEFVQPVAVIAVSFVVAFVAVALFMPLIKLLNDLS